VRPYINDAEFPSSRPSCNASRDHRVLSKYSNCLKSLAESDWAGHDNLGLTWSSRCPYYEGVTLSPTQLISFIFFHRINNSLVTIKRGAQIDALGHGYALPVLLAWLNVVGSRVRSRWLM